MIHPSAASSCSCLLEPLMNSCAYQTLSSLTERVADFAAGIFTAIAEFVKSCLGMSPGTPPATAARPVTVMLTPPVRTSTPPPARTATPPPAPAPTRVATPPPAAAPAPEVLTTPPAAPTTLKEKLFAMEKLFLNSGIAQFEKMIDEGTAEDWMRDENLATPFLATCLVYHLVMGGVNSDDSMLPMFSFKIRDTEVTFWERIAALRNLFKQLDAEEKLAARNIYIQSQMGIESDADDDSERSISEEFGTVCNGAALLVNDFIDHNSRFLECAHSVWSDYALAKEEFENTL